MVLLACGWWLASPRPAAAQEGLVLGGGGARGLAHGGVVVGLERLGRDPEIVVGASMGAIVGALYSAGYEPEEIWRIIADEDWSALFAPTPVLVGPDRAVRHPILRVGFDGIRIGRGLVPDWRINRRLIQLLFDAQARSRGDFDRLTRRFRPVATDLATGRLVVIGRGDLARAVRASMAVPGAFAPIGWDSLLLVDGGVNNYLPIPAARELGAGEVVAVDVLRPPPRIESLSPLQVGIRGLRLILLNTLPSDAPPDELVVPAIDPSVSEALFLRDPRPLLEAGLAATLAELGPGRGPSTPRLLPPPPARLGGLVVEAPEPALARLAERAFHDVAPGRYDPAAVLAAVDRLYATGLFTGVWPAVEDDGEAATLRVRLVPTARQALVGAPGYDNDRGPRGWAAFQARGSAGGPAEVRLAASAGALERRASFSGRLHSLRLPALAWTAGSHVVESSVRIFRDGDLLDDELEVTRIGGWVGAEWGRLSPDLAVIAALRAERIEGDAGDEGAAIGPLVRIAAIEPIAPVVGLPTRVEGELRFGEVGYGRFHAGGAVPGRVGEARVALLADVAYVSTDAPADVVPALGDEWLVPGLRWDEAPGRARVVAGVDVAYPIPLEAFARLRLRAGSAADAPARLTGGDGWIGGAEAGVLWSTAFGSLSLAVGASTRGDWRLNIDIGPSF